MIVRSWTAQATRALAPAYTTHLQTHVLPTLRDIAGYAGAMLLQRDLTDGVEIIVLTYWQSLEAIRAFAGDPIEAAVVAAEAAALLTQFDTRVRHYELVIRDGV